VANREIDVSEAGLQGFRFGGGRRQGYIADRSPALLATLALKEPHPVVVEQDVGQFQAE
jgi:hypothetical protein